MQPFLAQMLLSFNTVSHPKRRIGDQRRQYPLQQQYHMFKTKYNNDLFRISYVWKILFKLIARKTNVC